MQPLRIFALGLTLAIMLAPIAARAAGGPAPADEYFGPFKESILEVRNRLIRFEGDADRVLARQIRGIDVLEVTIEDWYRKYPRDPWIRDFSRRLARLYARAHAGRGIHYAHVHRLAEGRGF